MFTFFFLVFLQATGSVTLAWDPVNQTDILAGYKLHYGTSPGNYTTVIDVGNVTTYKVPGLQINTTYYFVCSAYGIHGEVSGNSNEVSARPGNGLYPPTISISGTLSLIAMRSQVKAKPLLFSSNSIYTIDWKKAQYPHYDVNWQNATSPTTIWIRKTQ